MASHTLPALHSGWTYALSGKPVAYVMEPHRPETTQIVAFDSWWRALHYAVLYAEIYPRCTFIGGPHA